MRVLLDECLPRRLKTVRSGHDVQTVPEAGWGGKENGDLLRLAAATFEALVTIDQNLPINRTRRLRRSPSWFSSAGVTLSTTCSPWFRAYWSCYVATCTWRDGADRYPTRRWRRTPLRGTTEYQWR